MYCCVARYLLSLAYTHLYTRPKTGSQLLWASIFVFFFVARTLIVRLALAGLSLGNKSAISLARALGSFVVLVAGRRRSGSVSLVRSVIFPHSVDEPLSLNVGVALKQALFADSVFRSPHRRSLPLPASTPTLTSAFGSFLLLCQPFLCSFLYVQAENWRGRGIENKGLHINGRGFTTLTGSYPSANTSEYIRPCAIKVEWVLM